MAALIGVTIPDFGAPQSYCNNADQKFGSCKGIGGDWSIAGYTRENCPAGYEYTDRAEQFSCAPFFRAGVCRKKSFSKSKAECCLKHTNDIECPPNFCLGKQDQPQCVDAINAHCKDNMGPSGTMASECWEWALANRPQLIDDYCKGAGGTRVGTDARCNAFANSSRSHGKMDAAVAAYCKTSLARANQASKGETICACYADNLPTDENLRELGNNVVPVCWFTPCIESGYKSTSAINRSKSCGDFCPQILKNVNIVARGDVDASHACGGGGGGTTGAASPPLGATTAAQDLTWLWIALGAAAALLVLIAVVAAIAAAAAAVRRRRAAAQQQQRQGSAFFAPPY